MWLLRTLSVPHFLRHRARTMLTLLGIALGVAAIVATTTVTDTVFRSFRRTVEETAGRAELQVTNGTIGVPEELGEEARTVPGVAAVAPLVEGFVAMPDGDYTLAIFGFDFLNDEVHDVQLPRHAFEIPDDVAFVTQPDSVVLPRAFASAHGYALGAVLEVVTPEGTRRLVVRGLVDDVGPATLFGGVVGLMDLPAAQGLLAEEGRVDRIDVRVAPKASIDVVARELETRLHGRARLERQSLHGAKAEDLLFSLRVVLALAALVCAVVGFFIIYHTVTVSMVQRRREIALLASLGVSRAAILGWFATEATILGVVAATAGLGIGLLLARISLVTINGVANAWVTLPMEEIAVSLSSLSIASAVGLLTTFAATLLPAWSAASQPPARFLHMMLDTAPPTGRLRWPVGAAGIGFATTAVLLAAAPTTLPYRPLVAYVFSVNCLVLVSFALISPVTALVVARAVSRLAARSRGLELTLASAATARNPASAVAVVAAIVMGMGWTLADFSLTASLRGSWLTWLDEHYQSDLLVSGGKATVTLLTGPPFAGEIVSEVAKLPGVREVQGMRIAEIEYAGRPAVLQALDRATSGLPLLDGAWSDVAEAFWDGAGVALGDNLAYKAGIHKGDTIPLLTPMGERRLPVLGVFSDFQGGGDLGSIAVSRSLYRSLWDDSVVNRMRVWTVAGADTQALRASIESRWSRTHGLRAVTAAEFRAAMAELIENIFLVSYALVLVAVTISFVGVVNFLLAALLDRRAELRTLDAIGVSRAQLRGAIVLEGALVGMIGAVMGVVAAVVVSRVIVLHSVPMVNGWHFTYVFPTLSAAALALAAVVMAAAAGLLPARVALGGGSLAEGSME